MRQSLEVFMVDTCSRSFSMSVALLTLGLLLSHGSHSHAVQLSLPLLGDSVDCVKPITLVDRWDDSILNSVYDAGELYDPRLTGWIAPDDTGTRMTIVPLGIAPIQARRYVLNSLPPLGKGTPPMLSEENFRAWMSGCAPYQVAEGDSVQMAGVGVGVLQEEVQALIDLDPAAIWDEESDSVTGSAFAVSPRLIRISFYDPASFVLRAGRDDVLVSKIGVLFLESVSTGNAITVRFVSDDPSVTPVLGSTWGKLKNRYKGHSP